MKAEAKSFYFSAYRLKTFEERAASNAGQDPTQSLYLKAVLSGKTMAGKTGSTGARVFPMINPYKEKMAAKPAKTTNSNPDTGQQ